MTTLTTLEMRNELGKLGVTIERVPCGAPFYGSVFMVSDDNGPKWSLSDLTALIRYTYRVLVK